MVPVLAGGGMYVMGAGGSAPEHAQQFREEPGECSALTCAYGTLGLYFGLQYYWITCSMHDINVVIIAANISGWYFAEDDYKSSWTHALKWSVFQQAGGNVLASAVMGLLGYFLRQVSRAVSLVYGTSSPWSGCPSAWAWP